MTTQVLNGQTRNWGPIIAFIVSMTLLAAGLYVFADERAHRDPCVEAIHSFTCKHRTCLRLQDIGTTAPKCPMILGRMP